MTARSHSDRVDRPVWQTATLVGSVALATAVTGHLSGQGNVSSSTGALVGGFVGLLAMIGLPSLSITQLARVLLLVSAAVLVRFGLLGTGLSGTGQGVLLWVVAAVAVLVLTHQMSAERVPSIGSGRSNARRGPAATARSVALIAGIVVLVALLVGPLLSPRLGEATRPGEGPSLRGDRGSSGLLRATDALDMTTRPRLDDTVVFTVESERGTFWRGQTFDVWDGRRWTRSDVGATLLADGERVRPSAEDVGAQGDDVLVQRFTMEAGYADVIHAAPSPVRVDIDRPVAQRADGTLVTAALGKGATYTVESRRTPLTAERLHAVDGGETPAAVLERFAQPPVTTDRVRELAPSIVEGATTRYDQVLAIEQWMGQRVSYSLEAPLAPEGVDVVDHFLFEAEEGWCEQIASSLVVLARANGIPARLVTGYVPAGRDPVTGRWVVRARQAHAWAEVWFPEVGWVPFDPTADVPLAGQEDTGTPLLSWLVDHIVAIALGALAIGLVVGPLRVWLRRRGRRPGRWRRRGRADEASWAARADRRLVSEGERWGRPRGPTETAAAHAAALAEVVGDATGGGKDGVAGGASLGVAGRLVDDALYAPTPPSAAERAAVDAVLAELAASEVPDPAARVPDLADPVPTAASPGAGS